MPETIRSGRVGQNVGEEFVRALAAKDRAALKAILRPDVDFRAMTPSRFWESADADVVVDDILLGKWFEPTDVITEVVDVETSNVGERQRVGYRFKVTNADGDFLVEQQGYFDSDGQRVSWMRIMCAGYMAIS
jgi:hypothetical protein